MQTTQPHGTRAALGFGSARAQRPEAGLRVPRQHGAWALIAVPLLVGLAAGRPQPGVAVLVVAALSGYLFVATLQSAAGARSPRPHLRSLAAYGLVAAASTAILVAADPPLAVAGVIVVPAVALAVALARRRRARSLPGSLAHAVQALTLAPVAAWVGGVRDPGVLASTAFVAAVYVIGSVLVVRSVIRERGNGRFVAASVALHALAVLVAAVTMTASFTLLFAALAVRAAAIPSVERLRAARGLALKPVFVGLEELLAGIAVVVVAFLAGR